MPCACTILQCTCSFNPKMLCCFVKTPVEKIGVMSYRKGQWALIVANGPGVDLSAQLNSKHLLFYTNIYATDKYIYR